MEPCALSCMPCNVLDLWPCFSARDLKPREAMSQALFYSRDARLYSDMHVLHVSEAALSEYA